MPPRALPGDLDFWMLHIQFSHTIHHLGDVAQMVERSLSMWEVGGSIPPVSKSFCLCNCSVCKEAVKLTWPKAENQNLFGKFTKLIASSGNRTRAARVAGEHSTTEPTMLSYRLKCSEPSHKVFIFCHYWRLDNGQSSPLLMPNLFVQKYMARPLLYCQ